MGPTPVVGKSVWAWWSGAGTATGAGIEWARRGWMVHVVAPVSQFSGLRMS